MLYQKIDRLSTDHVQQLHELYQTEWWTKERTLQDVEVMVQHSDLVFGVLETESSRLVGFARVLTDRVFKAIIFDVIVAAEYRNEGIGKVLMEWLQEHPDLKSVRHFELYCLPEVAPFYEKWGFSADLGKIQLMRRAQK
jgi:GNAT superfamily N-acetyltransferase